MIARYSELSELFKAFDCICHDLKKDTNGSDHTGREKSKEGDGLGGGGVKSSAQIVLALKLVQDYLYWFFI